MDPGTAQTYHPPPSYASAPLLPQSDEKSAASVPPARIVGYPGYPGYDVVDAYGGPLPAPGIHEPRNRRSRTRRFVARAVHMLMLLTIFIMLFPAFLRGIARVSRALNDWRESGEIFLGDTHLPDDCKEILDWTVLEHPPHDLLDEEFFHPRDHSAARTSLKLPVSSDLLYFISQGAFSRGLVRVLNDGEDKNDANVTVTYFYKTEYLLERSKVCFLQPKEDRNGVGIFTPLRNWSDPHDHSDRAFFFLDIHLPAHKTSSPLHIHEFRTDLRLFHHAIADLADSIHFDSIFLSTEIPGMRIQSLSADQARLRSSEGAITGNFTVKNSLHITTNKAPIVTNINMINSGEDKATNVTLTTSNRPVSANISLIATTDNETGGSFRVLARTYNSPIYFNFNSAPVNSLLHVDGATSNSPAYLNLHSTYEGSFELQGSTFVQPRVNASEGIEDPAGKGRKRNVEVHNIRRGTVEGEVTWEPSEGRKLGSAKLSSRNSPVVLAL